ncbi:MAG: DUF6152 family protein [Candidatus Rariloculaceae bacterium]
MRIHRIMLAAASAATLLVGSAALAHHGRAAYGEHMVTLQATVTEFKFINPHVQIYFDVTTDGGEVQQWQGELTAPNKLARGGWTKTTLVPGSEIQISGRQARNGGHSVVISEIIMPDGESMSLWEIYD